MKTREEIDRYLENIQFLSPNEPITPQGIQRVIDQMNSITTDLEDHLDMDSRTITVWNPNIRYQEGDLVLYFKEELEQQTADEGKREFAFILVSTRVGGNDSIPSYEMIDGIPDFSNTGWALLNPMSYLLQDLVQMKKVVKEVFSELLEKHIGDEHGLIGVTDIDKSLLKKDYTNLVTPWELGKFGVINQTGSTINETGTVRMDSNGIMEYRLRYSFDSKANQYLYMNDRRYYYEKSPIFDESDNTIFSQKYTEDNLFQVSVRPMERTKDDGTVVVEYQHHYSNLRYGTNIFHKHLKFDRPFINTEYMVFFDTYGNGEFVFGFDSEDIQAQTEPTWDAVVSMPMLMNKTESGFDIVLPIHCHFNSLQKYNVGVPWNNDFTVQAIGRYR